MIKLINQNIKFVHSCYKLYVSKLLVDTDDNVSHQIFVLDDSSEKIIETDFKFVSTEIIKLVKYYESVHKEHIAIVDKFLIRPLWKELNAKLNDPYAKVTYGGSITTHRGQGITLGTCFIDLNDMFKNYNLNDTKRCIYTSITRAANEVHLLV